MKKIGIMFLLSGFLTSPFQDSGFPEAQISNGILTAHFYLPDIYNGYYRATRFDWSGNTISLDYKGHSYYGKWFDNYEPTIHDVVMGPVEEFGAVGFSEAVNGGNFIKIGVGALLKPDDKPYNSFRLYEIKNPGKWKIRKKSSSISFIQTLSDGDYGYTYKKTVRLIKGSPEMVIDHTISNNGGKRKLFSGENIFCGALQGFSKTEKSYNIDVKNLVTGAGVRISSDESISKLVFWASPTTVCPEPYTNIKVEPGKEYRWKIRYEYYTPE